MSKERRPMMAQRLGSAAELTLYGDVVTRRPTDWRTGQPMEGNWIILSEVMAQLDQWKDVEEITVRIHSLGGNTYDAMAIHNHLKNAKAKVRCIVDGVAMSAASLILCAADEAEVYPGSIVMIHRCWAFFYDSMNAPELRKQLEFLESADRAAAEIYARKTGKTPEELLDMMSAETYMTGQEAVENGFADRIVEGQAMPIAASADRKILYAGGLPVWTAEKTIPEKPGMETVKAVTMGSEQPLAHIFEPGTPAEGRAEMPIKTIQQLREQYPELMAQAEREAIAAQDSAAQAERERMQAIDEVAALVDELTVQDAKYGSPCSAQEMLLRYAKAAAKSGGTFLQAMTADLQESGAGNIQGAGQEPEGNKELSPAQRIAAGREAVRKMQRKEE